MTLVPSATDQSGAWLRSAVARHDGGVIVHVAGAAEELPRLAGVIEAIEERAAFDQIVLDAGAGPVIERTLVELGAGVPVLRPDRRPELPDDLQQTLEESQCTTLIVHVDDHAGLCCALAAARLGISVVRVGGLPQSGPGRVIARLADVLLTRSPLDDPSRPGTVSPERVFVIGNPLVDVVQRHARAALNAAAWRELGVSPGGYVLVALTGEVPFAAIERALNDLAARSPVVLEAPSGYHVPGARVVSSPSFLERLSLERAAKSIFTDSARVHEEAAVLGVPCHSFGGHHVAADVSPDVSPWDWQAGLRAADAVVANFARVRLPA
jgi:hypothetical protein